MGIRVGTAGWGDPSLIRSGRFYPKGCTSPEARLRYYASQFPLVEVDSSYYALPSARNAELWAQRTPPGFTFNVKAFRLFTGHQTPPRALPPDITEAMAAHFDSKRNLYYKDTPDEIRSELWRRFEAGVRPLQAAGKLNALHFQFAPWVTPAPDWQRHIEECVGRMAGYLLAVEFRNRAWFDGRRDATTLQLERDLGVAHVVVDEPQASKRSIPQVWAVAAPELVVVRLHGRNEATWEIKGQPDASARFNYDYSDAELSMLAAPIKRLAEQAQEVHVVFNNNFGDQGQRNARSLMALLDDAAMPPILAPADRAGPAQRQQAG